MAKDSGNLTSEILEKSVVSVERSFEIIELLVDAEDGLSLAEISQRLSVNKAIASKLLNTLVALSLVLRDDKAQRFYATYRVSNLGLRQLQTSRLMYQCSHVLKSLAEQTGELVRLAIVEGQGSRLTWVYSVAGKKRGLQIDPNYTLDISYHTHAAGKAWLSTMPFDDAFKLCVAQGIKQLTPFSRVTMQDLKADLEEASKQGFVVSYEENEIGVGAIAAPIIAPNISKADECVGVVSISAPSNRMSPEDFRLCGPVLTATTSYLASIWPLQALARSGFSLTQIT